MFWITDIFLLITTSYKLLKKKIHCRVQNHFGHFVYFFLNSLKNEQLKIKNIYWKFIFLEYWFNAHLNALPINVWTEAHAISIFIFGSLQERVSKKHSVFKSTQIVLIFFGSTLKLEDQFLKNLKNIFSVYTFKKKVS